MYTTLKIDKKYFKSFFFTPTYPTHFHPSPTQTAFTCMLRILPVRFASNYTFCCCC